MSEARKNAGSMLVGNNPMAYFIGNLMVSIISLFLILLVGEYLWNNVLVKVTTGIKPVSSVWQILGIVILVKLILC